MIESSSLFAMNFFSVIENFMLKTNSMRPVIYIYRPPPLHEAWLDEAGRRQGNEDHIRQRRRNEDLMRDRNHAVRKSIPPPVATDVDDAGEVPGVALTMAA
jgi:hypothetical protein